MSASSVAALKTPVRGDIDISRLSANLSTAVEEVKHIQVLVTSFIDTIVVRKNDETHKEIEVIKDTIKQIHDIRCKLAELGNRYSNLRLNQIDDVPLGNTGYISLDPSEEQGGFYEKLLQCYTWLKNLDELSSSALTSLKRKNTSLEYGEVKRFRDTEIALSDIVSSVTAPFTNFSFNTCTLLSESYLRVEFPCLFSIVLFFTGFKATEVVVRSIEESYTIEPRDQSKHNIFQCLSDVFTTVLVRLYGEEPSEILSRFLTYVTPYSNMFTSICVVCNKHLSPNSDPFKMIPPVRKDLERDIFYHLSCK